MEFQVPELGEGIYEAELVSWLVKPGDRVKRGQGLMEVMTDKATMEVPSPFVGTIQELRAEPGETIKVGQVVLTYEPAGKPAAKIEQQVSEEKPAVAESATATVARSQTDGSKRTLVRAAPSVRVLAKELGIDLASVEGSGPGGRILLRDLAHLLTREDRERKPAPAPPPMDFGKPGTSIRLIGVRRKIAEHMVRSKRTAPHYSYVDECDVTQLVQLRESLKEAAAERGIKLTYLAFVVRAVVDGLKAVPMVNATLDEEKQEIVLHDRYDIGIAVAAPQGLLVPVVKNADQKGLLELAREIEQLSSAARAGTIRRDDLIGGTFTVTSIGNIGGLFSAPVINHPQVGILGLGKIVKRPVFDEAGRIRPADMLYLSFSFDHRVVDGAIGASFGNIIRDRLSQPARLLLD